MSPYFAKFHLALLSCLKMVILTIFLDAKNEMIKIISLLAPFNQFLEFFTPTIDKEPKNVQKCTEFFKKSAFLFFYYNLSLESHNLISSFFSSLLAIYL